MNINSIILRTLSFLTGPLLAVPVLTLVIPALVTPITLSGGLYLLGSFLALGGLVLILAVASVRIGLSQNEQAMLQVTVLPAANRMRAINALIDERDSLLFGEQVLHLVGGAGA